MSIKVVIGGQNTGANEFFLQNGDEFKKVDGFASAEIINFMRRRIFRRRINDAAKSFDDIRDKSKIACAVAEVKNLNVFTAQKFVGEFKIRHIGTPCRSVNGKKSQAGGRDIVKMAVAVSEELIAFFCGGVKASGLVGFVVGREGDFFIRTVNGAGAGVHEMLYGEISASFKDIEKAEDIAPDISVRIVDRVANAGLSGKIDNVGGAMRVKNFIDKIFIGEVAAIKNPIIIGGF